MTERWNKPRRKLPLWWRIAVETLGWVLVIVGIAALVLPGPGLLTLAAGLAVLSQVYHWADRWLHPVKVKAFQAAAEGVRTWPRILASCLGGVWIIAVGVFWGVGPPVPGWWPIADEYWLIGGWGSGITMIASGLLAFALIGYSIKRFRGKAYPQEAAREFVDKTRPE